MSLGSRLVLLKFVLSFLSVYFLSFFKAHTNIIRGGVCKDSRKIPWINCDTICLKRENDGLGVRMMLEVEGGVNEFVI